MRRRTPEDRYYDNVRRQQRTLEEFAAHEIEWASDLLLWYRAKKQEMPEDEYRACAFFKNREFLHKPGSLTLLYSMYLRCCKELPEATKELAFDLLRYRYKLYARTLNERSFS
jgi:hypothetical protein